MGLRARKLTTNLTLATAIASLLVGAGPFAVPKAGAAQLLFRSMRISDNQAGRTGVTYNTSFFLPGSSTVGSIKIEFCENSPLLDDVCDVPAGFDVANATLASQSGPTGFAISSSTTANTLILTRPPAAAGLGTANYVLEDVTNPTAGGALFARIYTYASSDASGPYTDFGGLALAILGMLNISLEVPPYLIFCIGESIPGFDCSGATEPFSDMGDLAPNTTRAAQHQMLAATNAQNGYSIWATGNTMTSGNNVITAMATLAAAQRGTSQFGMNMRANSAPQIGQDPQGAGVGTITGNYNVPNRFYFRSGEVLATTPTSDDYRKYTVSYIANVPNGQPGGVYSTTLTYTALANF
jgi:uncharacterized protein YbdZ (MbtH family)